MTLPCIRILQVGDLHLLTAAKTTRSVDQKDPTFSVQLRNVISRQPIKAVFKKLYGLLESSTINGVLFMGDMTDYGQIAGYKSGVSYVVNALQLGKDGDMRPSTPELYRAITILIGCWRRSQA